MDQKKLTLKEIAEKTGVSVGTVHRAIYGKAGVGEATRRRILREVERADYQIDKVASILKRGELTVAVALPRAEGEDRYYFRGVWSGIRRAAESYERYKLQFRFIESPHTMEQFSQSLKALYDSDQGPIHGLVTVADDPESGEWAARFMRRGVPVVLLSSYGGETGCTASVRIDHQVSSRLAADHLSVLLPGGQGRILVLAGHSDIHSNRLFTQGFTDCMARAYPGYTLHTVEGFGKSSVYDKTRRLLAEEDFAGVFACNARNTYLMCELLSRLPPERRIPFIGADVFNELGPYFDSGIIQAAVYQSHREQGERAVSVLCEHLSVGGAVEPVVDLPVLLAFRSNYRYFVS